jgi:hypothetical protein
MFVDEGNDVALGGRTSRRPPVSPVDGATVVDADFVHLVGGTSWRQGTML